MRGARSLLCGSWIRRCSAAAAPKRRRQRRWPSGAWLWWVLCVCVWMPMRPQTTRERTRERERTRVASLRGLSLTVSALSHLLFALAFAAAHSCWHTHTHTLRQACVGFCLWMPAQTGSSLCSLSLSLCQCTQHTLRSTAMIHAFWLRCCYCHCCCRCCRYCSLPVDAVVLLKQFI